jgi:ubiquinone/menaquinone biosynthesis C-methylase UbiE
MNSSEIDAVLARDEHHWWYRGRRRVLRAELDRIALAPGARILDAGCGSGRMLDDLRARGRVTGVDANANAVAATRRRGHVAWQCDIECMPFADASFDLVTCLDVLEHTPDDRCTLRELRRVTRPGGSLVLTVPAYQELWSAHDVVNGHYRRYRVAELRAAAAEAGWYHLRDSYFNALLLGAAAAVRLARRRLRPRSARSELELTPGWLDGVLEWPLRLEAAALRGGARLPFGLSLLAVFANAALTAERRPPAPDGRPAAHGAAAPSPPAVPT